MASTATQTIDEVIDAGLIRPVFQPIVALDTGAPVAFEALARGPEGSPWERPAALFAAAAERGRSGDLDWACRAAALRTARERGLGRRARLFVNVEPTTLRSPIPAHLVDELARADRELDVVLEITERSLAADPAALLASVAAARERGLGIAVDDVGAEPASLALMPVIDPDVIKLDMRLVHGPLDPATSAVARAALAQAERTGAVILAEGIETQEHLERAEALGARLGQGWLLGRPSPDLDATTAHRWIDARTSAPLAVAPTPFAALGPRQTTSVASKRHLLALSHAIERSALTSADAPIVLSTFQHARHLTPATVRRYRDLATGRAFVAAIGAGVPVEPLPGVRGAHIPDGHPLEGEWVVAVLGPFEAAALVARDLGDRGPEPERRFAHTVTHDRSVVIDVVRSTLAHVAAHAS